METRGRVWIGIVMAAAAAGCRTATHVIEEPRVDVEMSGGNRGYLVGSPPPMPARKTTRQMVETDVELPSFHTPAPHGGAVMVGQVEHPEQQEEMPEASLRPESGEAPAGASAASYDTYVVKQADTLSKIAARPEIYGNGRKWRRIYDANRTVLKSPNRVQAGMSLRIPRGGKTGRNPKHEPGEKPITFVK